MCFCVFLDCGYFALLLEPFQANCHPFCVKQFLFMHNGDMPAFPRFKRRLMLDLPEHLFELISGGTDSEFCFMLFLETLERQCGPLDASRKYAASELLEAMRGCISRVQQLCNEAGDTRCILNLVVSDGDSVIASRYAGPSCTHASLYYASGSGWEPVEGIEGEYHMAQDDRRPWAHIIASEPLTSDPYDWVKIPADCFCIITGESDLIIEPIFQGQARVESAGLAY